MSFKLVQFMEMLLLSLLLSGCDRVLSKSALTWHEKCGWKAEDYFDDRQVIALCGAIEANDLEEIDRLVAAGADVNAQGKGKMTPLLWAFPDNKLGRFQRLLEHGANPNVVIESDFNTHGGMLSGDSVTHMACKTRFPGFFEAVFEHGGDPNFLKTTALGSNETPLYTLIKGSAQNKRNKVQILIDKGTSLDHMSGLETTPTMLATGRGFYNIALLLLNNGADYRIYQGNQAMKLVHVVLRQERRLVHSTDQQNADYQKLVKWLKDHGESFEAARADEERWKSWSITTGEYQRKMAAEIAARKAREAREKQAAEEAEDQKTTEPH